MSAIEKLNSFIDGRGLSDALSEKSNVEKYAAVTGRTYVTEDTLEEENSEWFIPGGLFSNSNVNAESENTESDNEFDEQDEEKSEDTYTEDVDAEDADTEDVDAEDADEEKSEDNDTEESDEDQKSEVDVEVGE